jgi:hypothetical protein
LTKEKAAACQKFILQPSSHPTPSALSSSPWLIPRYTSFLLLVLVVLDFLLLRTD